MTNNHHLIPRQRGGVSKEANLLRIDIEKHVCWHKLFRNRNLQEIIALLQRIERIKKSLAH
jgi:hypothetical protein